MHNRRVFLAWIGLVCAPLLSARGQDTSALKLLQKIPMPKVQDRLDHLGVDVPGKRLFIAALGDKQNTVEVIDLKSDRKSVVQGKSVDLGARRSMKRKK